ncbi:MAG: putative Ig domain-containing protein, partial [Nanoarchaeota archaeon]|nr:putative Ig domain-containing protein [Nanoarchaeota archaeon]
NGSVAFDVSFTPGPSANGTYWLNITINDSAGLGDSQIFFINVTEGGFSPFFIDVYTGFCLTRTATEDSAFTSGCTIWACDNDTIGTLRFDANYSWFSFNKSDLATSKGTPPGAEWEYCASTTVNFTPTHTEVGNWSILLNVTDNAGFSANYTLYFNISSVNDAPVLAYIPALNASIDALFTFYANVTDEEDGNVSGGSGAIGNFTFSDNTTLFEINSTTGLISWTPNSSHNGTHFINITVNDTKGAQDSRVINITVAENAAPACTIMNIFYPSPTFLASIVPTEHHVVNMSENERITFSALCTDTETITYNWYWNASLNQTNTSSFYNYRTTYLDAGYYNMTLVVYDTFGPAHNNSYYITVNVSNVNAPPMMYGTISEIRTLNNGDGWYNNVQNSRNMTTYFYDLDNENLTYSWHRNAINETFADNNISRINSTWTFSGNWTLFNDSADNPAIRQNYTNGLAYAKLGTMNYTNLTEFKARIKLLSSGAAGMCFGSNDCSASGQRVFFNSTDNRTYLEYLVSGALSSSNSSSAITIARNTSYWLKAITADNLTTIYTSSNGTNWNLAYNQSINATLTGNAYLFTINAEAVFDDIALKDPDLRNMTLADTGGNNITFTPKTDWYGDLMIVIRASDGINYTDSNEFNLHVDKVTVPPPVVQIQTTTSTSTRMETKVADMTILVPSMISLIPLSKTIIPVILKNTGQLDLNTITLVATSNQSELRLKLNETAWTAIKIGDSVYVNLEVDIGLLAPDRYTIRIEAESQSPALKRFAEIVVDVREKDAVLKAQLKEMIQFTRDLFLQNPECLELTELINAAEEKFRTYQYHEGLELIHRANQGCKEFIAAKEGETKPSLAGAAKTFIQKHWKTIILEGIGLIIAILLLIYYFQRRSAAKL